MLVKSQYYLTALLKRICCLRSQMLLILKSRKLWKMPMLGTSSRTKWAHRVSKPRLEVLARPFQEDRSKELLSLGLSWRSLRFCYSMRPLLLWTKEMKSWFKRQLTTIEGTQVTSQSLWSPTDSQPSSTLTRFVWSKMASWKKWEFIKNFWITTQTVFTRAFARSKLAQKHRLRTTLLHLVWEKMMVCLLRSKKRKMIHLSS